MIETRALAPQPPLPPPTVPVPTAPRQSDTDSAAPAPDSTSHFELLLSQIRKQAGMPLPAEQAHSSALQQPPLQRPPHVPSLPQPLLPQLPIEPQPAPPSQPACLPPGRPRHAELATRSHGGTHTPPADALALWGEQDRGQRLQPRSPALPLTAAPAHGPQASSWQPPAQKAASSMQLAATNQQKQAPPNDLHGQVALAPLPPSHHVPPAPLPPQPSQRFQSNQRALPPPPLPQQPRPSAQGGIWHGQPQPQPLPQPQPPREASGVEAPPSGSAPRSQAAWLARAEEGILLGQTGSLER